MIEPNTSLVVVKLMVVTNNRYSPRFNFVAKVQSLLDISTAALRHQATIETPWSEWGPETVRVVPNSTPDEDPNLGYLTSSSCGAKLCFHWRNDLEIFDFNCSPFTKLIQHPRTEEGLGPRIPDVLHQDIDICGPFAEPIGSSRVPFSSAYRRKIMTNKPYFDEVFIDESRVVGFIAPDRAMKHTFFDIVVDQFRRVPPVVYDGLSGKHVVVIGANIGIGFEAAKHFARMKPAKLILACRSQQRGEEALKQLKEETRCEVAELWLVDLANFSSVKAFANLYEKEGGRLDLLIANAAFLPIGNTPQMTAEGWELAFQTNVLSQSLLSLLLLPRMLETAHENATLPRLVVVSSDTHYFSTMGTQRDLLGSEKPLNVFGSQAFCTPSIMSSRYFDTKLLNVLFTRALADRLRDEPLIVDTVNPGYCYSGLRRGLSGVRGVLNWIMDLVLARSTEKGARQLVWAAVGAKGHEDRLRGAYINLAAVAEPSDYAVSKKGCGDQNKLWDNLIDILAGIDPRVQDVVQKHLISVNAGL
ncbi:hypothetical protein NLJ89_g6210 [Agrocybe chaxingu]|uniref:Uncharacterized protein n=1 Tax=Agrocybe chaxingu TaxID=84603 RepID=A0A9W8K166_9AGAR|nr:hypothetical protein NLJ89_g6210 [Agrocybe chaxingu]